ncbi:IDEAL domain-containing protein [Bacillus solimangrovi]|uniref:IDEAL domain-containing protein n=1 Tax=Bacillus solimangrovi TaxID=1305675 RepID=A0A1E5LEC5_9BACI|nr:IDEAL domain-containing protein [Bacillus solimangrovi]OEH92422.1 hypothetical protein BFG57_16060 [Bacillus solimangrovi]
MNQKKFHHVQQQHIKDKQHISSVEMDIYIQMILDEANLLYRKNQLEAQINEALDQRNRERFIELTIEYKQIQSKLT